MNKHESMVKAKFARRKKRLRKRRHGLMEATVATLEGGFRISGREFNEEYKKQVRKEGNI